jgi:hypothetical protein
VIRRKLTLRRVDPWSVLKFGFVVNLALLLVGLLGFWILWIVVGRLGLVDQFCDSVGTIVLDLQECSLNGGNIFRTLLFLGLLGVVVQTGIVVFGAFLYNLISDLTGGLAFTFLDDSDDATLTTARRAEAAATGSSTSSSTGSSTTGTGRVDRGPAPRTAGAGANIGAGPQPSARPADRPVDQSSTPARPTPDGPAATPRPRPFPERSQPPAEGGPRGGEGAGPRPSDQSRPEPSRQPSQPSSPRPSSSGSLWGDPTRSNDRS